MCDRLETVHVVLGDRSYEIVIGSGWLDLLPEYLADRVPSSRLFLISDGHVAAHHGTRLAQQLQFSSQQQVIVVPPGESSKSLAQAERIWESLLAAGADRQAVLLALGGGVIGDLVGFVAANFVRGVRYVQIPTSLLAQVDSSVGGKVAVNLPQAKNMVGCIWQPSLVAMDISLLSTLPEREFRSGLAEVIKYGVILDAQLFQYLAENSADVLRRDPAALTRIVARSCQLKAGVVMEDERDETGRRAILNYGHTFGHALESVAGYGKWLHGEAVSAGMQAAARLARRLGYVTDDFVRQQQALLRQYDLPTTLEPVDPEEMLAAMWHDKKVQRDRLRFVLPRAIGQVELCESATLDDVRWVLSHAES